MHYTTALSREVTALLRLPGGHPGHLIDRVGWIRPDECATCERIEQILLGSPKKA